MFSYIVNIYTFYIKKYVILVGIIYNTPEVVGRW